MGCVLATARDPAGKLAWRESAVERAGEEAEVASWVWEKLSMEVTAVLSRAFYMTSCVKTGDAAIPPGEERGR